MKSEAIFYYFHPSQGSPPEGEEGKIEDFEDVKISGSFQPIKHFLRMDGCDLDDVKVAVKEG